MPSGTELLWGMAGAIALLLLALKQTAAALHSQKRIDKISAEAARTAAIEAVAARQPATGPARRGRGKTVLAGGAAAAVAAVIAAGMHPARTAVRTPGRPAPVTAPKPSVPAPKIPHPVVHAAHWLPPSGTEIVIAVIVIAVLIAGYRFARLWA
jgi:hypothetical protein